MRERRRPRLGAEAESSASKCWWSGARPATPAFIVQPTDHPADNRHVGCRHDGTRIPQTTAFEPDASPLDGSIGLVPAAVSDRYLPGQRKACHPTQVRITASGRGHLRGRFQPVAAWLGRPLWRRTTRRPGRRRTIATPRGRRKIRIERDSAPRRERQRVTLGVTAGPAVRRCRRSSGCGA
jgi:hypothetical protein